MKSQGMRAQTPISLTVVAVLAATACSALAADVEVYGRIDTGFLYTINHNDTANNIQMTSGHSSGSRFGFKGGENLGSGWKAKFVLESGVNSDDGTLTYKQFFSRQSTLSLSHKSYGELAFGRAGKPLSGSDQFTRIRSFLPFGVTYGDAGVLFYGRGGRMDNAVFYESPTIAGFTALLSGSLNTSGDEAPHWQDNTRFVGGSLDWKRGNFGLMVGMEKNFLTQEDHSNGQNNPTAYFVGTYYDFGVMKLMAAYQRGEDLDRLGYFGGTTSRVKIGGYNAKIQNFDANSWLLGATMPIGAGTLRLSGQYSQGTNDLELYSKASKKKPGIGKDAGYWAVAVGYTYPFSKRTNVYGVVSHLQGLDALKQERYTVINKEGDLRRNQIAIGLVHKF